MGASASRSFTSRARVGEAAQASATPNNGRLPRTIKMRAQVPHPCIRLASPVWRWGTPIPHVRSVDTKCPSRVTFCFDGRPCLMVLEFKLT